MIRVRRSPKPEVLVEKDSEWRDEYLHHLSKGTTAPQAVRYSYRHPTVKAALRTDSHDKCAYCESKVPHTLPGDIEHIRPVSHRPELIVDWDNLAFVCRQCNQAKRDYYSETHPLVDPYKEEPRDHLRFVGPLVFAQPGSERGVVTQEKVDLNRAALVERKIERLEDLQRVLVAAAQLPDGPARDSMLRAITQAASSDKEYSATVTVFLAAAEGSGYLP